MFLSFNFWYFLYNLSMWVGCCCLFGEPCTIVVDHSLVKHSRYWSQHSSVNFSVELLFSRWERRSRISSQVRQQLEISSRSSGIFAKDKARGEKALPKSNLFLLKFNCVREWFWASAWARHSAISVRLRSTSTIKSESRPHSESSRPTFCKKRCWRQVFLVIMLASAFTSLAA